MTALLHKIKNRTSKYFIATAWPWEIMSGLFIVLIIINSSKTFIDSGSLSKINIAILIVSVNLLWAVVDGLLLIFTNLLEKGRSDKLVSIIKSSDKNLGIQTIVMELNRTIITSLDEKTKVSIAETTRDSILLLPTDTIKRFTLSSSDIFGSIICIVLVFSPSILILPFFLLIKNIAVATVVSDVIGILLLFSFGFKLGSHIQRNGILIGLTVSFIGLAVMIIGAILGA